MEKEIIVPEYDYTNEASWGEFCLATEMNQIALESFILESNALAIEKPRNLFESVQLIHEEEKGRMGRAWDKIIAFLDRIWAKFIENMTRFINTDEHYLKKYEDIIKKKPVQAFESVNMRQHNIGIQRIAQAIPLMNDSILQAVDITEGVKIQSKLSKLLGVPADTNPDNLEYAGLCKEYFIGDKSMDFKAESLNLTNMFNFCYDFKRTKGYLEKDKETIKAAAKEATENAKKAEAEEEASSTEQEAKPNGQGNPPTGVNTGGNGTQPTGANTGGNGGQPAGTKPKHEAVLSKVTGVYITEEEGAVLNKTRNGSGDPNTVANTTQSNIQNRGNQANISKVDGTNKEKTDDLEKRMTVYINTATTILSAKMTAADFIKKDYMKIIKAHVAYYVGTGDEKAADQEVKDDTTMKQK